MTIVVQNIHEIRAETDNADLISVLWSRYGTRWLYVGSRFNFPLQSPYGHQSALCLPYIIRADRTCRNATALYRRWLREAMNEYVPYDPNGDDCNEVLNELSTLSEYVKSDQDFGLICGCPDSCDARSCHTSAIIEQVEWLLTDEGRQFLRAMMHTDEFERQLKEARISAEFYAKERTREFSIRQSAA